MSARRIPLPESSEYPGSEITDDVLEFVKAMVAYQKKYHRRYPGWSEALYVLRTLGYAKLVPGASWDEAERSEDGGQKSEAEDPLPPT